MQLDENLMWINHIPGYTQIFEESFTFDSSSVHSTGLGGLIRFNADNVPAAPITADSCTISGIAISSETTVGIGFEEPAFVAINTSIPANLSGAANAASPRMEIGRAFQHPDEFESRPIQQSRVLRQYVTSYYKTPTIQ